MKVTIKGVDPKLWEEVQLEVERSKFQPPRVSTGELVNEALRLRQEKKAKEKK